MYNYNEQKAKLFTPEGVQLLFKVRQNIAEALKLAGAVRMVEATKGCSGDSWTIMAAVDYFVERREIREITGSGTPGQFRVFVAYS